MRSIAGFIGKHWLTLGLLAGSVVLVVWIVRTQRAPGSMTVVEAQGMDMTTSKPPPGTQPVAVEEVSMRSIGGMAEYPATVAALSDEDVVARVQGRVSKVLVYPGDRVRAGMLVATLEANELSEQADQARLMAVSKSHMALGTEHDIEEHKAMLTHADAALRGAKASKSGAQAEAEAAEAESKQAQADAASMRADIAEMEAQSRYSAQELAREQRLYKEGAVSLDEAQAATKEKDMAAARVRSAQAKAKAADNMAAASAKKALAAKQAVVESTSMVAQARADIAAATTTLARAYHEQDLARLEAQSYAAGAKASETTASYRELRALADGVVSERTVSPGTAVMPGQVVVRIKAVDTVRVQADLPQSLFGIVKVGTPVFVVAGDKAFEASVGSVFPLVDENSRTFKVEALLRNKSRSLAVGMYVKLRVQTGAAKQSLAVRSSSVLTDPDGLHYVWVLEQRAGGGQATDWTCTMHPQVSEKGPGKCPICGMDLVPRERSGKYAAAHRPVDIGATDGTYTAVMSGLKAGERVLSAGYENLEPGMAVEPKEGSGNEGRGTRDERGSMPGMDMSQPARGRSGN